MTRKVKLATLAVVSVLLVSLCAVFAVFASSEPTPNLQVMATGGELSIAVEGVDTPATTTEGRYQGTVEAGKKVTLTASGDNFIAFFDPMELKMLSKEKAYTFTMGEYTRVAAVYEIPGATVIFQMFDDVYMLDADMIEKANAATFTEISNDYIPSVFGKDFDKWSLTVDEVQAEITKGTPVVYITPLFKDTATKVDVTVEGGTVNGGATANVALGATVTLEASAAPAGKVFSHWTDGSIALGTTEKMIVSVTKASTYTAVFADAKETLEAKIYASLGDFAGVTRDVFVYRFVPKDMTLVSYGLLFARDYDTTANTAAAMVVGAEGYEVKTATGANAGAIVYHAMGAANFTARPYMIVKAADGTETTVYGDIVAVACTHKFDNYHSNNDATCDKDGTKTGYCDYCGKSDTQPDVGSSATAKHQLDGPMTLAVVPTFDKDGAMAPTCSKCGAVSDDPASYVSMPKRPALDPTPLTGTVVDEGKAITVTANQEGFYRVTFSALTSGKYFTLYNEKDGEKYGSTNRFKADGDLSKTPVYVYLYAGENKLLINDKGAKVAEATATFTQVAAEPVIAKQDAGALSVRLGTSGYTVSVDYKFTIKDAGLYFINGLIYVNSGKYTLTVNNGTADIYTKDIDNTIHGNDVIDGSSGNSRALVDYGSIYLQPGDYTFTIKAVESGYALTGSIYLTSAWVEHNFVPNTVVAPGCETEGYTATVCTNCGAVQGEKTNIQAPTGHIITVTVTTAPTKDAEGLVTASCSGGCGQTQTLGLQKRTVAADALTATVSDDKTKITVTAASEGFYRVTFGGTLTAKKYFEVTSANGIKSKNRIAEGDEANAASYVVYAYLTEGENTLGFSDAGAGITSATPVTMTQVSSEKILFSAGIGTNQRVNAKGTHSYTVTIGETGVYLFSGSIYVNNGSYTINIKSGDKEVFTTNYDNTIHGEDKIDGSTATKCYVEFGYVYLEAGEYTITLTETAGSQYSLNGGMYFQAAPIIVPAE